MVTKKEASNAGDETTTPITVTAAAQNVASVGAGMQTASSAPGRGGSAS